MIRPLLLLAGFFFSAALSAQVQGISYTLAPTGSYNWFNDASGLDDAFMIGGRIGIGFGEFVELRGSYQQTVNQSTNFAGLDLDLDDSFLDSEVDLARYAVDLKLNLARSAFMPYLLLGGGIQDLERQGLNNAENIFGDVGLGFTLSAADRFTLGIEGKYIGYSFNAAQNLFDDVERVANNLDLDAIDSEQVGTYSVAASLQFYLGGRRPGQLSDLDRQYLQTFAGGLSGLSVPFEPGIARVNWDDALPYRDLYLAGGGLGLNFGPFIGLRGYYYQGMGDDLDFDFGDLAMYGGDLRFNLSRTSTGFQPFATLGYGRIDVGDGYNDNLVEGQRRAQSQGFASGGGGLALRLTDHFTINGGVKALLTSGADFEDINSTDQLTTSWMYTAGLNFVLGGKNGAPEVVREETMENKLDNQRQRLMAKNDSLRNAQEARVMKIREKYEARIADLNDELDDALAEGDTESAANIKREKQNAERVVVELDARQNELREQQLREQQNRMNQENRELALALGRPAPAPAAPASRVRAQNQTVGSVPYDNGSRIVLTPQELNQLLDRVDQNSPANRMAALQDRLDRLEQMMSRGAAAGYPSAPQPRMSQTDLDERFQQLENSLLEDIRQMQDKASEPRNPSKQRGKETDASEYEQRLQEMEQRLRREMEQNNNDRSDYAPRDRAASDARLRDLEQRLLDRLDRMESDQRFTADPAYRQDFMRDMTDYQSETLASMRDLQDELRKTREDLMKKDRQLEDMRRQTEEAEKLRRERRRAARQAIGQTDEDYTAVFVPNTTTIEEIKPVTSGNFVSDDDQEEGFFQQISYTGMSGIAGFNIGDAGFLNLGLRWHYKIGAAQRVEFMPEAFFGIGTPTTFGIFGNLTTPVLSATNESRIQPYVGIGAGVMQVEDSDADDEGEVVFRPAVNLLVGTYLPLAGGRVFAEFATRNFLANNQIAAGYRFNF